jgi:catechol 2,3-dioxygenase-like lactoylglutathione lyase family enzyme
MSLGQQNVAPVIPVSDLERSLAFYEGRLGLSGEPAPGGHLLHASGDTRIYLLTGTDYAGIAEWPLASFAVDDLARVVADLERNGVSPIQFEEGYQKTDERGIADLGELLIAWITDPDGQVISIFELTPG